MSTINQKELMNEAYNSFEMGTCSSFTVKSIKNSIQAGVSHNLGDSRSAVYNISSRTTNCEE